MKLLRKLIVALVIGGTAMTANADEALDRKMRSLTILQTENLPTIAHLPVIATEAQSIRRAQDDVLERAIALIIVAVKGETRDDALVQDIIRQYGAETFFTPSELAYLNDPSPSDQNHIQFLWRYEAAYVMLWALGFYDTLPRPDGIVNVSEMADLFRTHGTEGLRNTARLRSQSEILDANDLAYRYHWAVVDARVNGLAIPDWVQGGVIYERHYALNWLTGYLDRPWDEVSTDT